MNEKSKKVAVFGISVALAFTLSFLESLMPLNIGIPGIKLGLANIVVTVALYTMNKKEAFLIAVIRIILAGITFGNTLALIYSLAGGLLSFFVMSLAMKGKFSVTGVGMLGAVSHNIAQIIVACILLNTKQIAYYLPVLLIAGLVTGALLGMLSTVIIKRLDNINKSSRD